ncbi:TrkA family potassium uptake protein [Natroniella sulfidigena]|uniref:potassium channel family protein n=1 Tax=Natroniella sulfidigena TaxID=723921 RepID=UPI00200ACAC5|nr:TrkA family potassium uptake protein [Natroniella sulfidigena]MCK8817957.1 TrkA family potassium uptake protein [Natroniella sulfidigena]
MKQFAVIGVGRFGTSVAKTLIDKGYDVLAIDYDEERVQDISSYVTHAVQADATDETALKSLGLNEIDSAIVSIGDNLNANILATLILKELGVEYVVAKAQDNLHGVLLTKIGADKVVYPERDMGQRLANNLISANLLDYIELSPYYRVAEILATGDLVGRSLKDLDLRRRYGVNVIAAKTEDGLNVSPGPDYVISQDDLLVVMGEKDKLEKVVNVMCK